MASIENSDRVDRSVEHRVTELEKRDAVNDAERRHINTRLENLDAKMEAIGVKVDQGFEKIYASLRWPITVVAGGLLLAIVTWVVSGGAAV
tara:strand:+ start:54 stop:326 length:273 start_codon:yes stop_codon:yes gene_type:complete